MKSVSPKALGSVLAVSIALVGILGTAQALQGPVEAEGAPAPGGVLGLFYLDGEYNAPALLTAMIWLLAGLTVYAAGRRREQGRGRLVWTALAAALAYLALDEAFKLHERVEGRAGEDWQLLFAPLLIATALAGLYVVLRVRGTPRLLLLAAGGAALAAQVLELVQWNGDEPIGPYRALMVPEEILELTAAALVAVGALMLLREIPS